MAKIHMILKKYKIIVVIIARYLSVFFYCLFKIVNVILITFIV